MFFFFERLQDHGKSRLFHVGADGFFGKRDDRLFRILGVDLVKNAAFGADDECLFLFRRISDIIYDAGGAEDVVGFFEDIAPAFRVSQEDGLRRVLSGSGRTAASAAGFFFIVRREGVVDRTVTVPEMDRLSRVLRDIRAEIPVRDEEDLVRIDPADDFKSI